MTEPIIRIEGLGKKYLLRHQAGGQKYRALRDTLTDGARTLGRLFRGIRPRSTSTTEEFWALQDVSFEVAEGEVVGIIGRNGAGKSTLLKILSRITEPTRGRVVLNGRVASLLEVGTGFHPELTGRENVYLNGSILGMSRAEITRKFDEIVAFAEVEQFLDTPVKRYSSGMYVRLAFAVAAHLEPEILIIDEVLAVGDAQFQRKCLAKMGEVAKGGRTVLFVSHDMTTIQRLCSRGVLLNQGKVAFVGETEKCVAEYLQSSSSLRNTQLDHIPTNMGDFRFANITITDLAGQPLVAIRLIQPFQIHIRFSAEQRYKQLIVGIGIHAINDFVLFATHTNDAGRLDEVEPGIWEVAVNIAPNFLRDGNYYISLGAISCGELIARVPRASELSVEAILDDSTKYYDRRIGALFIPMEWSLPTRVDFPKALNPHALSKESP